MRPIDADKLKKCYMGSNGLDNKADYMSIRKMIDNQPTIENIPSLKIGDEIWYAFKDSKTAPNGYFEKQKITEIRIKESGVSYITNKMRKIHPYYIGKLYFRSYEEAKEALSMQEEMDDNYER